MLHRLLKATLFPYTTLFRSCSGAAFERCVHGCDLGAASQVEADRWTSPRGAGGRETGEPRSEEHTSELQSRRDLVCRPLLEKKKAPGARFSMRMARGLTLMT